MLYHDNYTPIVRDYRRTCSVVDHDKVHSYERDKILGDHEYNIIE